jgi:branched-chain amino acid transport system substrate-binding protein
MMFDGAMVGLQYATIRVQLGENLNGVVNYELWAPGEKNKISRNRRISKKVPGASPRRRSRSPRLLPATVRLCGNAVLEQAITATTSLDDAKLAEYIHGNTFHTIVGDIAFDARGEGARSRVLTVQFQNIKGTGLEQYMKEGTEAILYPTEYKNGEPLLFAR